MKHLAVITARSGSKGLKDKNIKLLEGKPLLVYSIEAARQSGKFDCIHVSTDSEKYAQIARKYGADVPFLRDAALATDTAGTWDVLRAVVQQYAAIGQQFDRLIDSMFILYVCPKIYYLSGRPLWHYTYPFHIQMK